MGLELLEPGTMSQSRKKGSRIPATHIRNRHFLETLSDGSTGMLSTSRGILGPSAQLLCQMPPQVL